MVTLYQWRFKATKPNLLNPLYYGIIGQAEIALFYRDKMIITIKLFNISFIWQRKQDQLPKFPLQFTCLRLWTISSAISLTVSSSSKHLESLPVALLCFLKKTAIKCEHVGSKMPQYVRQMSRTGLARQISRILGTQVSLQRNVEFHFMAKRDRSIYVTSTGRLLNSECNELRVRTYLHWLFVMNGVRWIPSFAVNSSIKNYL